MDALRGFDLNTFRAVHIGLNGPIFDLIFLAFSYLGVGQTPAILAILFVAKKDYRYLAAPVAITCLSVGLLLVHVLKDLVPRDRPSNLAWAHPQEPHLHGSFPSGHTTIAFCIAVTLLMTARPEHRRLGQIAIVLAPFVGLSRIYRGVHWPTDVMGGALLGTMGAIIVWLLLPKPPLNSPVEK